MKHRLLFVLMVLGVFVLVGGAAQATLLASHFGVNPTLTYINNWNYGTGTYSGYQFTSGSLNPTLHTGTTDYQVNDWFGQWSTTTIGTTTSYPGTGTSPAGAEPYDNEAYYFDDDGTNLYFAVIVG
ncbi:MAG: hypothetical protein WCP21_23260, partial [Armatimonadota bacterium]